MNTNQFYNIMQSRSLDTPDKLFINSLGTDQKIKVDSFIKKEYKSAYVYLATDARNLLKSNLITFVWDLNTIPINTEVNKDSGITLLNLRELKNIVGIRVRNVLFYSNIFLPPYSGPNYNLFISEFSTESFILNTNQYHFSFYTQYTDYQKYNHVINIQGETEGTETPTNNTWVGAISVKAKNNGSFWFNKIFNVLPTSLSLTFSSGSLPIPFPILTLNFTISGNPAIVVISTQSAVVINKFATLTGPRFIRMFNFTTTKPDVDAILIEKVNNPLGYIFTNINIGTNVSLEIPNLDLSGLQGLNDSYGSYAEFSFSDVYIPLEIIYE